MSEPVKVTDARLTECLAKLGGECPFCGNTDPECRDREETGESVLYIYDCPKCDRHWTEIYDLTSIAVDADDAAEGETGYSKGPVLPPLDVHELVYRDGILDIKASHPLFVLFATECAKMLNELKAENFLTLTMEHEDIGHFSVIIQKVPGKTPNEKLLEQNKIIEALHVRAEHAESDYHALAEAAGKLAEAAMQIEGYAPVLPDVEDNEEYRIRIDPTVEEIRALRAALAAVRTLLPKES